MQKVIGIFENSGWSVAIYRSKLEISGNASKEFSQYGVGISISLDKLVAGFDGEETVPIGRQGSVDVLICSVGHYAFHKEKISLMKEFLDNNVPCAVLDESQVNKRR